MFRKISIFILMSVMLVQYNFLFGQEKKLILNEIEVMNRAVQLSWEWKEFRNPFAFRIYRGNQPDSLIRKYWIQGTERTKLDYWLTNDSLYFYQVRAVDSNKIEIDTSEIDSARAKSINPEIFSISPTNAYSDSELTLTVYGRNFTSGDTIKLRGGYDEEIYPQKIIFLTPEKICCKFDIKNKPDGVYKVVLLRESTDIAISTNELNIYSGRFKEMSVQLGLLPNKNLSHGCAWGDLNLDSMLDLLIVNQDSNNQLFLNNGNSGQFAVGPNIEKRGSEAVSLIDFDNDGDIDIFNGFLDYSNCLFENRIMQGELSFKAIGDQKKLLQDFFKSNRSVSWIDLNKDGRIDFYSVNYQDSIFQNFIFIQDTIRFIRISAESIGVAHQGDISYCASWADYNNDGQPDLYVGNGVENRLFKNLGNGTFTDVTVDAKVGCEYQTENFAWGDYNNDGYLDLYLANTNNLPNILYKNNKDGTFSEVDRQPLNFTGYSFAPAWGDYDNDGDLDLFLGRGGYREGSLQNNEKGFVVSLFENRGNDEFIDVASKLGLTDSLVVTSAIWGDYDNDGYLDLFVTVRDVRPSGNNANKLYRNPGGKNKSIKIRLVGTISNKAGIGARIELPDKGKRQIREISGGEGRSHSGTIAHFGLGQKSRIDTIVVKWPSGIIQFDPNGAATNGNYYDITEPNLPKIQGLVAEAGVNEIILTWEDIRGTTEIESYNIYRDTSTIFREENIIKSGITVTTFRDSVQYGKSYTYWIRGINQSGSLGLLSNAVTEKSIPNLAPPKSITAIPGSGFVVLEWNNNRSFTNIETYNIYRDTTTVYNSAEVTVLKMQYDSTKYVDSTVINGITYTYWIRGFGKDTLGSPSEGITVTPQKTIPNLAPPDSISAIPGSGFVVLEWKDNRLSSSIETFNIYRIPPISDILLKKGLDDIKYIDSSVTNLTTYTYWIRRFGENILGDTSKSVSVTPHDLGDFNPDGKIDARDIVKFKEAYRSASAGKLNPEYDIGPAMGQVPNLFPIYDGKLDFEDVVVFIQLWRWSLQNSENQYNLSTNSQLIDARVQNINITQKTADFILILNQLFPFEAAEFMLKSEASKLEIKEVRQGDIFSERTFLMDYKQPGTGITHLMLCKADDSENLIKKLQINPEQSLLKIKVKYFTDDLPEFEIKYRVLDTNNKSYLYGQINTVNSDNINKALFFQNFPNPFNQNTIIQFAIPDYDSGKELLEINIYNINGQLIKCLYNDHPKTGMQKISWNGVDDSGNPVSSGVYLSVIKFGKYETVKKILLVK